MARPAVTRNSSHENQTWIAILAAAINQWKRENDWSRETVADQVVQAHVNNSSHLVTGITFDLKGSGDEFRRQHTNANKLFRWLDDLTKDNNLLPANFIRSILQALPMPIRQRTVNALLADIGLTARPVVTAEPMQPLDMLRHIMQETADVTAAYADLVDGIEPGELQQALEATISSIAALTRAKGVIQTMMETETEGENVTR
jgi:hypothetical protein